MENHHILLLGATGATGKTFITHYLSLSSTSQPYLSLYVRSRSKLLDAFPFLASNSRVRIVEGSLSDQASLTEVLTPASNFPKVTTTISFLGAIISPYYFFTRQTPTPITNALRETVIPLLRKFEVQRLMVLSTPTACSLPGEKENMSWKWSAFSMLPKIVVPQGNAEMIGIAESAMDSGLDWTVFRVPHLNDGDGQLEVSAGYFPGVQLQAQSDQSQPPSESGKDFTGGIELSRESLVKWLLKEIGNRSWVGEAPMVSNI